MDAGPRPGPPVLRRSECPGGRHRPRRRRERRVRGRREDPGPQDPRVEPAERQVADSEKSDACFLRSLSDRKKRQSDDGKDFAPVKKEFSICFQCDLVGFRPFFASSSFFHLPTFQLCHDVGAKKLKWKHSSC